MLSLIFVFDHCISPPPPFFFSPCGVLYPCGSLSLHYPNLKSASNTYFNPKLVCCPLPLWGKPPIYYIYVSVCFCYVWLCVNMTVLPQKQLNQSVSFPIHKKITYLSPIRFVCKQGPQNHSSAAKNNLKSLKI